MFQELIILVFLKYCDGFNLKKRASNDGLYLDETFFMSLENYQMNAKHVNESRYPWIARVVHSSSSDLPHMCTAVCIDAKIFITAARCIYSLKVKYTRVIYQNIKLPVLTFVFPSKPSKQLFDDIGFMVVSANVSVWKKVSLYDEVRSDSSFQWFFKTNFQNYKVVGYAAQKGIHKIKAVDRIFNLTELPVIIKTELCSTIMTVNGKIKGFRVPCYHSCDIDEFINKDKKCSNYHGVEGGAVLSNEGILLGIATWGAYFHNYELPVGFSVVNSANFYSDFDCAKRIRAYELQNVHPFHQDICVP